MTKLSSSFYLLTSLPIFLIYLGMGIPSASAASAERITADNVERLQKSGPDAIGGIDDWHLSNGTLCAVVSDPSHEHEFSHRGAALVDLGFCDRADDHYTFNQDLLDGDRRQPLVGQSVRIVKTGESAVLVTEHTASGVKMETRYQLDDAYPTQLRISKRLTVTDAEAADFNLISLGSFNYHSLEPFVLASQAPAQSAGFANVDFVTRGTMAIPDAAHDADTLITISPPEATHPIAYAWQLKSATRVEGDQITPLPRFVLADEESMAFLLVSDTFWVGNGRSIGWLQLPQIPFLGVSEDVELHIEEVIYVGDKASVAAVSDQLFDDAAEIFGRAEPGTAVHLMTPEGNAVSHDRVGADGTFSFKAPPGEYQLKHLGSGDRRAFSQSLVSHGSSRTNVGQFTLPQASTLQLPQGQAMRLVFSGLNETADPDFNNRLTDFQVTEDEHIFRPKTLSQVFLAGVESDPKEVAIAPGDYQIWATRGLEYSVESTQLTIASGEAVALTISPPSRQITTRGYIAADFHVHAGSSFDNTFSDHERVRTFVAEGGEIMVNTEHDVVVDFAPLVSDMGVDDKITALTGTELTSLLVNDSLPNTGGHINFFPYQPKPNLYRKGAIAHEARRLRDVMSDVRAANPGTIAQLNHPRRDLSLSGDTPRNFHELIDNGAFLDHMGVAVHPYQPRLPLTAHPNRTLIEADNDSGVRDLDFDAIELVNPGGDRHAERIEAVRRDWLSFLRQGEHITGTANSDSHRGSEQVAVPRNMVAVDNDDVNDFSRGQFLASIRSGNLYGTTGPMLNVSLNDKTMGAMVSGKQHTLKLEVFAADWIPVQRATIEINGHSVVELDLADQRQWELPINVEQDAFLTIQIFGQPNELYTELYPGIEPYAFTNPIYIDADNDGKWTAPGLDRGE